MAGYIRVPYLDQSKAAPTGCEIVTSVMLLRYLGFDMTVDEFIDRWLEKRPLTLENGALHGPDPREYFAGDPRDPESMGCYAPVIARTLRRVLGPGWEVVDETGAEIDELIERYVDTGMPVPLWTTIDLRPHIEGPDWLLPDGSVFHWRSNEHCLLLVGSEGDSYVCNDPWANHGVVRYDMELMRRRHREQHMQAVGVRRL